jgi:hypothetical protein
MVGNLALDFLRISASLRPMGSGMQTGSVPPSWYTPAEALKWPPRELVITG